MSNKLIKDKPKKKKQSKLVKHLLSIEGSTKGIPHWYFYLVVMIAIYAVITNVNW